MDYNRKELVDWVRGIYQNLNEADKQDALRFFPELRESEDEIHRKWILEYLYDGLRKADEQFKDHFKSAIDWLEKQKEQNPAECRCTNDESEYDKGYREGHRFGLKQTQDYMIGKTFKGLIPCWINAPSTLSPLHQYHGKNAVVMHENNGGFRCICIDEKEPVSFHIPSGDVLVEGWKKKSIVWSIEDELYLSQAIKTLEYENYLILADKLKSLHLQPKVEWSEEDERYVNGLIGLIEDMKVGISPKLRGVAADRCIAFLKSLCPQSHWKPSEEQIQALEYIVSSIPPNYLKEQEYMMTLIGQVIQQLKKL